MYKPRAENVFSSTPCHRGHTKHTVAGRDHCFFHIQTNIVRVRLLLTAKDGSPVPFFSNKCSAFLQPGDSTFALF